MNNQICCSFGVFSKDDFDLHRKETVELLKKSAINRSELVDGFSFIFNGDETLFVRVAKWVSREHLCCPWAKFQMSLITGTIVLTVTGGGENGKQVLLEGFKILEEGGI